MGNPATLVLEKKDVIDGQLTTVISLNFVWNLHQPRMMSDGQPRVAVKSLHLGAGTYSVWSLSLEELNTFVESARRLLG